MKGYLLLGILLTFLGLPFPGLPEAAAHPPDSVAPVYAVLWFDTEDYILPQSDDAAKRLAETLTRLGVRATFKVVGEKARVLERRGRTDVIRALQKHEIGYHSDWHSRQPTVAVYLQNAGWDDGISEFLRREGFGIDDVRRIFGVDPVCYGQPGGAWAPQAYPALRTRGIRMYLDEAGHVGLDQQPFYYGGMLNVFNLGSNVVRVELGQPGNVSRAIDQFQNACARLRAQGGGTISIYYHPCEFVHKEFWDAVNFSHGRNPLPADWKLPPVKSPEEVEKGFTDFEQYIRYIQKQPGVTFVTASELMRQYADTAAEYRFNVAGIQTLAKGMKAGISFQRLGDVTVSPADTFWLLTEAAMEFIKSGALPPYAMIQSLDGPARTYIASSEGGVPAAIPYAAFTSIVSDVYGFCRSRWRVPEEVWIGAQSVPPAVYLATTAAFLEDVIRTGHAPVEVQVLPGKFVADRYVANDSRKLWSWLIFPEGFHSPTIMDLARLQAWTLKPAVLHR